MNNSSAQQDYLTTLNDTFDVGNITIDVASSSSYTLPDISSLDNSTITLTGSNSVGNVVIGGGYTYSTMASGANGISAQSIDTITISNLNDFNWMAPTEWVNGFPDWGRIEKMCNEYPALKIAFEKFKTTYKLVQDDYDTPPEKRIKP